MQIDTSSFTLARAGLGVTYADAGLAAALNYVYSAPSPETGNIKTQHEIGGKVTVPVAEYWSASAEAHWDISAGSFLQVGGGLTYNDGFLEVGASAVRTGPTHRDPDDTRFLATFRLMAPAGLNLGYSGAVPLLGN